MRRAAYFPADFRRTEIRRHIRRAAPVEGSGLGAFYTVRAIARQLICVLSRAACRLLSLANTETFTTQTVLSIVRFTVMLTSSAQQETGESTSSGDS